MRKLFLYAALIVSASLLSANTITWTDWTSTGNNTVLGTMGPFSVTYSGAINFAQTSGGTNYWIPNAPYLSATVSNEPPAADIISITDAGAHSITFSGPVTNPIFAVVSVNGGNNYVFDQPFQILSYGTGYWGGGTLTETGNSLGSTGEGHGAIQFLGTYSAITWTTTVAENWNGFTIGYDPTAAAIAPEPGTLALFAGGFGTLALWSKRKRK